MAEGALPGIFSVVENEQWNFSQQAKDRLLGVMKYLQRTDFDLVVKIRCVGFDQPSMLTEDVSLKTIWSVLLIRRYCNDTC